MGLDMYLEAEKYIGGWEFSSDEERERYQQLLEFSGTADIACSASPHAKVAVTVASWRKANAIHRWFVENVQGGSDDCGRYYVDPSVLEQLRATAATALGLYNGGKRRQAAELLPPQAGFFFGSTDVDENYAYDLRSTVEQLDRVLNRPDDAVVVDLYYSSSW